MTKTPKTFEEQLEILTSRELKVEDREKAIEVLRRINYYRLSAYMLTFKKDDKFEGGITFNEIFIQHHISEYKGKFPAWVSIEVVSLNLLSKMYSNLKNEDKSKIAKEKYI